MITKPDYVYVASSWRNPMHTAVCAGLRSVGIDHYDFKNPEGGTGFSWREVKTGSPSIEHWCANCGKPIAHSTFAALGKWEPDWVPASDPVIWRHVASGYGSCDMGTPFASPGPKPKGSDWTVTRRHVDTWTTLKPGDRLTLIEKGMGLPKGAHQVVLAEVEIVDVREEMLDQVFGEVNATAAEGLAAMSPGEFVEFWARSHGYGDVTANMVAVTPWYYPCRRIEWRYLEQAVQP